MKKFYIILYFLLAQVNIVLAQNTLVKEQINAIKLDESYLYGEAKNKIEDVATIYAKKELLISINTLREEKHLSPLEESDISNLYQKLFYQRGELVYVFTYLKKDKILNNLSLSTPSNDSIIEEENDVDINPRQIIIDNSADSQFHNEILQNVIERQMIENVYGYLQHAKEDNKIEQFAKAKSLTEIPDNAYIIIYNRMYQVVTILTNIINDKRINLKTNKPDLITNYSGHGVLWYINK